MSEDSIPDELLLPTPRTVRLRSASGLGCSTMLVVAFGLVVLVITAWVLAEPILIATARVTQGVVTDLHKTHGRKGSTGYHVGYRYSWEGTEYSDSESVEASIYQQLHLNQPIGVRAFHSVLWDTSWLEPLWQHYAGARAGAWAATGMFDAFFLIILWSILRQRNILQGGTPTLGQLVSKKISKGKSTSYWMTFEFEPQPGKTIQKKATVTRAYYDTIQPGETLCVIYDPNRPKRALLYGTAWFECAGSKAR